MTDNQALKIITGMQQVFDFAGAGFKQFYEEAKEKSSGDYSTAASSGDSSTAASSGLTNSRGEMLTEFLPSCKR